MQFPPEFISTKISKLLRHYIIQTLVVLGNIVDVAVFADGLEKSIIANKHPTCMRNTEGVWFISGTAFNYSLFF